jgi:hypothetical protein
MNDDSPDICVLNLLEALCDAFAGGQRALEGLLEVNTQDAAALARAEDELARAEAEMRRAHAELVEFGARAQCEERRIAEGMAARGATCAELGAGVQRQWKRVAALMTAMLSNAESLERAEARRRRTDHLLRRWQAQDAAGRAWRAWLATLAASRLHDDQSWAVMPSWSPWTGLAPPAIPLTVQCVVQRK